ncbi:MAG: hypothetical protein COA42_07220 [Alteromonadaceae bacterium]|nr:MAG: hypothetical protein COA42_07220 [Alteromonadaceae bacterium]
MPITYRLAVFFGALTLLVSFSAFGAKPQALDPALLAKLKQTIAQADSFEDRFDAEVWLMQKSSVLKRYVKDDQKRLQLLKEIHKAASRAEVAPELVLAVIQTESHFNQYALSSAGAMGMMQIMPFWKNEIGRDADNLIDIKTNLQYGCTILKHYLDKAKGDWREALARYNGSYGSSRYSDKVILTWQKDWR